MNFHGTKKIIVTDGFHDLWHGTKKLLSVGFEILGLAELWYKVAQNPNTCVLNWKQCTPVKAKEDALQYIKMYVAGVL